MQSSTGLHDTVVSWYELGAMVTLRSYGSPRSISGAIQKAEPTRDSFLSASLTGSSTTSLASPKSVTRASRPRAVTRMRQFWGTQQPRSTQLFDFHHIIPESFKTLTQMPPSYISDLLKLHAPIRSLRSADKLLLYTPRSRCVRTGDRAFAVAGPKLWNQLPLSIRQAPSLSVFKSRLKTHLYVLAFPTTWLVLLLVFLLLTVLYFVLLCFF